MEAHVPTSPTSPVSPWPPQPDAPAHPNAKEAYGFLAAIGTYLLGLIYLVWAFTPGWALERCGITWYPDREWAILVPAFSMVVAWLIYWTYAALMVFHTPDLSSLDLITDRRAHPLPARAHPQDPSPFFRYATKDAIPEAWDAPLGMVCAVTYGRRRRTRPVASRSSVGEL